MPPTPKRSPGSLYITDPVFSDPTIPSSEVGLQEQHLPIDSAESPACYVLGMQFSLRLPIVYPRVQG